MNSGPIHCATTEEVRSVLKRTTIFALIVYCMLQGSVLLAATAESQWPPQTLRVAPGETLSRPSMAAKVARYGDTIEISAGTYENDAAVWLQNNLTIRGVGGLVRLAAKGASAEGKGIWVIKGNNTVVENI